MLSYGSNHGTAESPASDDPQGRFTFVGSSGGDTHGRFDTRPAGFGRGRELQTPQPRLKHQALTGAPPAANRSYSTTAAASAHVLPPMPRYIVRPPPAYLLEIRLSFLLSAPKWPRSKTAFVAQALRLRPGRRDAATRLSTKPTRTLSSQRLGHSGNDASAYFRPCLSDCSRVDVKGHFGGDACASFRSRL